MKAQKPASVANSKRPAAFVKLMKKPVGKRSVLKKMQAPAEEDKEDEVEEEEAEKDDRGTASMPSIPMPPQLSFDDASKSDSDEG